MKNYFLLSLFVLLFSVSLFQSVSAAGGLHNSKIDSLLLLLKNDKPDTNKIIHSYKLCKEYADIGLYDTAFQYVNAGVQLAQQLLRHSENPTELRGIKISIANSFNTIGMVYLDKGNYPKAFDYYFKALKLFEELKDKNGMAKQYGNIGTVYWHRGNSPRALDYYFKALKMNEEIRTEFDKKEALSKAENEKKQAIAEEKSRQQKNIIWSVVGGLLLLLVFTGFIFRSLKVTRKQKYIIELQKNEVSRQKDLADSQRIIAESLREIAEKQKEELIKKSNALQQSYYHITLLSEIGKEITSSLSVEKIIEKTYESINKLMDASGFYIGIYDAEKNRLYFPGAIEKSEKMHPVSSYDLSDKNRPAVWCFNNQKEVIMNDIALEFNNYFPDTPIPEPIYGGPSESIVYIPLTILDKRIGVISVQSFKKNAYTNYHISIVRNLAVYICIALENAQLYENVEAEVKVRTREVIRQKEELEISYKNIQLLSEIGQQITAMLSVEAIIEKVYENINKLMDASAFLIGIYDAKKNDLSFKGAMEKGKKLPVFFFNLDDKSRPAVWCFKNQREVIINDLILEYTIYFPDKAIPKPIAGEDSESLIYIPLTIQDKKIGVITVQSFKKYAYSDYHINIVRNLAIYVSIALENARLYENMEAEVKLRTKEIIRQKDELEENSKALQQSYENITSLSEIGQKITSTLNLETIMDTVYENVNSLMDAVEFGIGIYVEEEQVIDMQLSYYQSKKVVQKSNKVSVQDDNRLSVWCVKNKKEVFINDMEQEYKNYIPSLDAYKTNQSWAFVLQSLICLPLIIEQKVCGLIYVQSTRKNAYKPIQLEMFRTIASYTAVALNNSEAYKKLNVAMQEVEKLSIVASNTDNGVVICNPDAEMIWANDAFTRTFGYTLEELKKERGKTVQDISSNPNIKQVLNECIEKRTGVYYESKNRMRNNLERWFQTTVSPVFNDNNELRNIIIIDSDITERKITELELAQKNKEITDSITYAKRIQTALLTSDEYIKNNIPAEHFILFKPKDIVSGDFYWALSIAPLPGWDMGTNKVKLPSNTKKKNTFYMITADCTGHGVPGAFMSMLNISYFNENIIERGIRLPHEILNSQREAIIHALNPVGSTEEAKDGMDCILCVYDFDKMLLHFSAANTPLWFVRNGVLTEYKADKMPVGKHSEETQPFTLQTIELQKEDIIYTTTDGFADQFGCKGKKLMKKKFKEELLKIHHQPMCEQKEHLNHFFENWKGNNEQVDDVCVIGIKI